LQVLFQRLPADGGEDVMRDGFAGAELLFDFDQSPEWEAFGVGGELPSVSPLWRRSGRICRPGRRQRREDRLTCPDGASGVKRMFSSYRTFMLAAEPSGARCVATVTREAA